MRWHPRTQEDGRIILIPKGDFTLDNLGEGGVYMGGMLFFSIREIIRGIVISILLKKNLLVVNMNYLLMTYNFKHKSRHLL